MSWSDSLKITKKVNLPVIYIIALAVVLALLAWWFSLKPVVKARDFLPESTSFYYHWTDRKYWSGENNQLSTLFNLQEPQTKLENLQAVLGKEFTKVNEIIWLQTEVGGEDHYLVQLNQSLGKKELESLTSQAGDYHIYQLHSMILLVSQDEEINKQIPELIVDKFVIADSSTGINLYFDINNPPKFVENLAETLKGNLATPEVFLNIDWQQKTIDLYQRKVEGSTVGSWSAVQIPNKFQTIVALSQPDSRDFINKNLLPALFPDLPHDSLVGELMNSFLDNIIILEQADNWLIISRQDWQSRINDLRPNFLTKEVTKILPDGTRYIELVKNEETKFKNFELTGRQYWQLDDLWGTELGGNYYLSNSEELVKDMLSSGRQTDSLWQDCLQTKEEVVTDWLYLDKTDIDNIGLNQYFTDDLEKLSVFSYENYIIKGIKLCY